MNSESSVKILDLKKLLIFFLNFKNTLEVNKLPKLLTTPHSVTPKPLHTEKRKY
jgi:hypothetical protein